MDSLLYYIFILVVVVLYSLYIISTKKPNYQLTSLALILAVVVACFLGFSPIPWNTEADKEVYALGFLNHMVPENGKELVFAWYTYIIGCFTDNETIYFLITAVIYTFNYYFASKKINKSASFLILLMSLTSFFFYGYGVNTIRAGLAASFFLLAFANINKPWRSILYLVIATNIHSSMLLPTVCLVTSYFYKNSKICLLIWVLSIPLSLMFGTSIENLLSNVLRDERVNYLSVGQSETQYETGFRIDFILYSFSAVFMGALYIFKYKYRDAFYTCLYRTYLLTNIFWILVIRANFSDRFAYLSWFMMPFIFIYPLTKNVNIKNKRIWIVSTLACSEFFIFFLFIK